MQKKSKRLIGKYLKSGIGITFTAVFLVVIIVLNVVCYQFDAIITRFCSGMFTEANTEALDYSNDEVRKNEVALTKTIEGEGAVLLKNDNDTLPLNTQKINLIGYASYNPAYSGAGSVNQTSLYDESEKTDYYQAFEAAGYSCNPDMLAYYERASKERDDSGGGMLVMSGADYNIYDEPMDTYRDVLDEAVSYSTTAIVVIARVGGEGNDAPLNMDGYYNGDAGKHYLELQQSEQDMISYCEEIFDTVIVLINSSNTMELGFLENDGIDAALWIGNPGDAGLEAVAEIISGEINPSGRLSDTYAYDITTAPSYYSATAGTYANADAFQDSEDGYDNVVDGGVIYYVEGIYVGYHYYETAAAENYIDYDKTVQYPFGYGMSYTDFDWEVAEASFGDVHGTISIKVKVTNTGNVSGKDVVELYFTAPYYTGGIEKSEKVLCSFEKTDELAPGESQVVELVMDVDDIASYDYSGEGCYVADEGDYYFNLQTDSHNTKAGSSRNLSGSV